MRLGSRARQLAHALPELLTVRVGVELHELRESLVPRLRQTLAPGLTAGGPLALRRSHRCGRHGRRRGESSRRTSASSAGPSARRCWRTTLTCRLRAGALRMTCAVAIAPSNSSSSPSRCERARAWRPRGAWRRLSASSRAHLASRRRSVRDSSSRSSALARACSCLPVLQGSHRADVTRALDAVTSERDSATGPTKPRATLSPWTSRSAGWSASLGEPRRKGLPAPARTSSAGPRSWPR